MRDEEKSAKVGQPPSDPQRAGASGAVARPGAAPASGAAGADDSPGENRPSLLPSVKLPKGGGALSGIGEKFATNLATGTGSLTIPVATSAGRGGVDLHLELTYDS